MPTQPSISKQARPLFPKTRHANSDAMGQPDIVLVVDAHSHRSGRGEGSLRRSSAN